MPEEIPLKDKRITVVTAIGLTQILGYGSTLYLPAVLTAPITSDTGWDTGWVVGALSIGLLVSGIVSPRVGVLIERYGGRPVLSSSALIMAAGLLLIGLSPTIYFFLLAWVILGVGMGAGLYDPAFSALGRLYGENARSAITQVTLFGGFASTVCWPLSAFLAGWFGWRGVCFTYAAIHVAVVLPVYLFVLPSELARDTEPAEPAEAAEAAEAEKAEKKPEISAVKKSKSGSIPRRHLAPFLLLAAGHTLASLVMTVIAVHILTLLQAGGIPLSSAVAFGTLIGPSQVGARIIEAAFGRKLHPIWSLFISIAAVSAGIGIIAGSTGMVAAGIILYGAGNGIRSIARGTVPLALFGKEGYAILMGWLSMPVLVTMAASPLLGTFLMNKFGPSGTMNVLFILAVLNIFLALPLLPYALKSKKPASAAS